MASNSNNTKRLPRKLKYRSQTARPDVPSPMTDLACDLENLATSSNITDLTPKRRISWTGFQTPEDQIKENDETTPQNKFEMFSDISNFMSAKQLNFNSPSMQKAIDELVGKPLATPPTSEECYEGRNCIRGLFREPSVTKSAKKRNEASKCDTDTPQREPKRRKALSMASTKISSIPAAFSRCYSESEAENIINAVELGTDNPDLIGDFSRPYSLPMIEGKHQDLKSISAQTMFRLLNGEFEVKKYAVIDCRFPYEYEGGHIRGAVNVYSKEILEREFLKDVKDDSKCLVLIFHCEFSSERGPSMCRFLREKDRGTNEYPSLHYPEIYVLDGGYKAFFDRSKEFCVPQSYKPMLHAGHEKDLVLFRTKSKNWDKEEKKSKMSQLHGRKRI